MIENFIEYMWYLLTTPLKKLKKALNKWYILCRVFGKRFDEAKEDILRARDEGMVATCSHEMLPVHGADRRLTRYEGEHPENFRSRIAMYEEICKLGGTNEGVLLAVRTLGYTSPVLVRANDLTGFSHFTLDGSWLLDGSRTLESDTIENRWAEFYIVIVMDADEEHPISFDIMRKTVRKWKEVGAKDNYFFKYNLSIRQPHTGNFLEVLYKKHLFYYDYRKLDGMWKLDGSYMLDAEMTPVGTRIGYRYESLYELHEAGLAVISITTDLGGTETVRCILAGFDVFWNNGDTAFTKHHAVIVPKDCFKTTAKMNDSNVTTGGYVGSKMYTTVLPVYQEALQTALNNHILSHRELLTTAVSTTGNSNAGAGFTGYASNWEWKDCLVKLMSEIQVYGSTVLSSSFYDTGCDNIQFPLFRLAPNLKVAGLGHNGSRMWYWLSAVVSAAAFALCRSVGRGISGNAAGDGGVRLYFCIG